MSLRIAIVDHDKCKPNKCRQECKSICPSNSIGKKCITIENRVIDGTNKPTSMIAESFCIGCGLCVKKCPFEAIKIIRVPYPLNQIMHKYDKNSFQIHNLPTLKKGSVLGLIGANGCGKTTCLNILCNKILPNFGQFNQKDIKIKTQQTQIIQYFRGSELQNYFKKLFDQSIRISIKPQCIEQLQNTEGTVGQYIEKKNQLGQEDYNYLSTVLSLDLLYNKNINVLSGGELQRFAIAATLMIDADIYIFDEPSSYLDIKQRIKMAQAIRFLLIGKNKYIIVVEHDLSILDYLSDQICLLYGKSGVYGVCSLPYSVREGINMYLDGYIAPENIRFRNDELNFKFTEIKETINNNSVSNYSVTNKIQYTETKISYPHLTKTFDNFQLSAQPGNIYPCQINVLLGPNGTGKTTFIKMLVSLFESDLKIGYKPQKLKIEFNGTVREFFEKYCGNPFYDSNFNHEVIQPLDIGHLMDHQINTLSGGELQRVMIIMTLGKQADIYLIDEPSAYLDIEQRLVVSKVIKKFMINNQKYCFLVEHDFIMSTYLADRIIIFDNSQSNNHSTASSPYQFVPGFNQFLKILDVTFRRDPTSYRPRINKLNSQNDRNQKSMSQYFICESDTVIPNSFKIEDHSLDW